jgi:hypothetical protein
MEALQIIFSWLLLPLSGASAHDIAPLVAWHARLMVLAWSVLIPLGVLAARFYKVMPGQNFPEVVDNKMWWHAHRALQYGGVFISVLAVGLVFNIKVGFNLQRWHYIFGYALLILGILQIIGAQLRGTKGGPSDVAKGLSLRGDHFDMTRHRRIFEWLHKRMGYAALLLTLLTTAWGLALADAPRWMALVIGIWWLLLIGVFMRLQKQGRSIDTYTAIWGKPFSG